MRHVIGGALLAAALLLQGCSNEAGGDKAPSSQTGEKDLAKALADKSDLSKVAGALKSTGLAGIFANAGSYTLLAPTDAAFAGLGDKGKALESDQDRAVLTAVVRDHLVPGYLTRDDIAKAIEANSGKPVKMGTLGSGELSFAKSGDAITVTAKDGISGKLSGDPVAAGPSIALPIDAVLKKL
jgi:uncharacterized surface protein with fasciclin (FAS1) repeats